MAVPAQNLVLTGSSQIPVGQGTVLAYGGSDHQEVAYKGTATFTLDGATTSATLNWVDGTQGLFFSSSAVAPGATVTFVAPSAVIVSVTGGNQGATAVVSVVADTITTTGCTIRFSAAGTNTKTLQIAVIVLR